MAYYCGCYCSCYCLTVSGVVSQRIPGKTEWDLEHKLSAQWKKLWLPKRLNPCCLLGSLLWGGQNDLRIKALVSRPEWLGGGGSLRHCRGSPTRKRPGKRINTRTGWMGIKIEYLGGWRVVAKRTQADVGHFSQNPKPQSILVLAWNCLWSFAVPRPRRNQVRKDGLKEIKTAGWLVVEMVKWLAGLMD